MSVFNGWEMDRYNELKRTSSHLTNFSPSWSAFDTSTGPNDTYVPVDGKELAVLRGLCCGIEVVALDDDGDAFVGVWCCGDCCSDLVVSADVAIFVTFQNMFLSHFWLLCLCSGGLRQRLYCSWGWCLKFSKLFCLRSVCANQMANLCFKFSTEWKSLISFEQWAGDRLLHQRYSLKELNFADFVAISPTSSSLCYASGKSKRNIRFYK